MMGSAVAQFLDGERRTLGLTHADLEAWRPTRATRKSINVALARATFEEPLPAELMDAHAFGRAMSPKVGPDTGELSADRGELSLDALRDRKLQRATRVRCLDSSKPTLGAARKPAPAFIVQ